MRPIRNTSGFTIVELLIVIVVIAILAAVTIVAFNGIRTRAENAKTLSGIDQYAKALQVYKADNGKYPLTGGTFQYGCVSESDYCAKVGGPNGADCASIGASGVNTTLNGAIKTVTGTIPAVSDQEMQCQSKTVKGALYVVYGNLYVPSGDPNAYIIYYLKGNQSCTTPAGSTLFDTNGRIYYADGDTTRCFIKFQP